MYVSYPDLRIGSVGARRSVTSVLGDHLLVEFNIDPRSAVQNNNNKLKNESLCYNY